MSPSPSRFKVRCAVGGVRHSRSRDRHSFDTQRRCPRASGRVEYPGAAARFSCGRSQVRLQLGAGPDRREPRTVAGRSLLRHREAGPDPAVHVLRPGQAVGLRQARAGAVVHRAFDVDVPVRHPRRRPRARGLPHRESPVPEVQGTAPGQAPVHRHRRAPASRPAPSVWRSMAGSASLHRATLKRDCAGCWSEAGLG